MLKKGTTCCCVSRQTPSFRLSPSWAVRQTTSRLLRLKVSSVLDDSGPGGRFGLSPQQQLPYNAFVSKPTLQRALEQPGRANALFVSGGTLDEARSAWYENFSLEDARLVVRTLPAERGALIESERVVLDPAAVTSIAAAADASAWHSSEVLTYLANTIESGGRSVPYSTVTALEVYPESLRLINGASAPRLSNGEILLNQWAADDLRAQPSDTVKLTYYVVGPGSELQTASHDFELVGIVRMAGAALDRDYAPTYKGMSDKTRISGWDPPFPMDLRLIRPQDETVLGPLSGGTQSLCKPAGRKGIVDQPVWPANLPPPNVCRRNPVGKRRSRDSAPS